MRERVARPRPVTVGGRGRRTHHRSRHRTDTATPDTVTLVDFSRFLFRVLITKVYKIHDVTNMTPLLSIYLTVTLSTLWQV